MKKYINKILLGDSLKLLPTIEKNSVDIVLTDPPYFLDKMDEKWEYNTVTDKSNQYIVKSLPSGMKLDKEQGKRFYTWYFEVSKNIFDVLKPGGFFFSFSSPRLYHRMASAVDDAGFLIRDCFIWLYTQNQAKAMSLNHFIDKSKFNNKEKDSLKKKLNFWKTPQLKSCFEPIVMAQKPQEETFLNNMIKHRVGLVNTAFRVGDSMFPANVMSTDAMHETIDRAFLISKPTKKEKGDYNTHQTVKPLSICEHIINLTTFSENSIVLDPFVGSGTTAVAAKNLGRKFIGIDSSPEYVAIAKRRLKEVKIDKKNINRILIVNRAVESLF
ncbi:MAG: methyltransferase [Candidatus Harrisonbacteria bacterium RIFCSPLOWO2_02_FULL_41_11]|uniref:Methyltransferase n=1 Tax=Candidatus Harrisonbacteria bacterium RIFCSPHIGHO2_02_FULL_42_16 TaxID=1798404 RepID=A0A1G1ZGC7_9BACT|nr:MAG: methyltransferase [Candidatus Harrisonbacteria bacterium RIFCSPHIGHO2_02_FULL_42_16]OGY65786.1 MAG: methyltransferase [Candidatus Harrisonbacteria bacterium RIFCSPLOWO2_02_FULL_41_11]